MAELERPMDGFKRVLEGPPRAALTPELASKLNERKFRKIPSFNRPVTENQAD